MTSHLQLFSIAFRIFKRDWKRGDLLVLLFAICIAMASVSIIYLLVNRIEGAMATEVADVLGADLVITSPKEVPQEWLNFASSHGLQQARSVEFSSVLFANEKLQLSSVKAVSDNYPLKGSLQIADSPYTQVKGVNHRPPKGKIWIEPRIYNLLGVNQTDQIEVGYTELNVDGVLMRQPGQGSTLFNIAPTAIMNIDDLPATKIIQPGSRVNYRYLFTGSNEGLKLFAAKVNDEKTTSQRIVSIYDESPLAGSALTRSKKYMGLSTLLTMILLGVAIAMSASRYARKQFDMSALMRCFGMNNRQVLYIFTYILLLVCFFGVILGGMLGVAFQQLMISALSGLFVDELPDAEYSILVLPMLAAVILLFGFALPALMQLKSVPPMRVLRRQLKPMKLSGWFVYLTATLTIVLVMWLQMGNIELLASVLLGLVIVTGIFALIAAMMLKIMKKLAKTRHPAVNFSLRQLDANKAVTLLHLMAFSTTIFVISLIVLIRGELMLKWQQSLGEGTPNHFMVNVKPEEVEPLKTFFESNELAFAGLYPMIRGRIVGINGEDIKTAVSEEGQRHNSLRRELNITWSQSLPRGNQVVEGDWYWPEQKEGDTPQSLISIEDKTALALGLKIGDQINFTIGSEPWSATIANIRSIDWQTFTPNFYIIANPDSLSQFNATYITSFFMPKEQKQLLSGLIKNYPAVTVIELDLILEEIQSIISKVSKAVELIMIFVVAAGVALLWAAMEHTFDSKFKQSAILRTLGASKAFIARSFRFEYFWLAILSSLMAVFAVELVSYFLYRYVFEIPFEFHWTLWWTTPMITLFLMLTASWRGVKKVTEPAPLTLIRGN